MTFERLDRREAYRSPWVNLFVDRVRFPNGRILEELHLVDFDAPSVAVIVEDQVGRIALVKVPRYTIGEATWELPAGWGRPLSRPLAFQGSSRRMTRRPSWARPKTRRAFINRLRRR